MDWKLFLDDERYPLGNTWVIARNFDDAVWYVTNYGIPNYISFDHDLGSLGNRTGMDFAKWFADHVMDHDLVLPSNFDFYVHSQNPIGAENIRSYISQWLKDWR